MDDLGYIVDKMLKVAKDDTKDKTKPYDAVGTVKRIDGDTAWVHFDNGVTETPVAKSINCKIGDKVHVRISNGNAFIIGNETAPPTDDTKATKAEATAIIAEQGVEKATGIAQDASNTAEQAQTVANEAKTIAGNTEQHFWFTETGTDTGAHIAEITKDEWDVMQSGGNLLARSNGIAVRDGMTELASFSGTNGAVIGEVTGPHVVSDSNGMSFYKISDKVGKLDYTAVEESYPSIRLQLGEYSNNRTYSTLQFRGGVDSSDDSSMATYLESSIDTGRAYIVLDASRDVVSPNNINNYSIELRALKRSGTTTLGEADLQIYVDSNNKGQMSFNGKATLGALDNGIFFEEEKTLVDNASISAGGYFDGTMSLSKTGYYPLGVVGWYSTTRYFCNTRCYIYGRSGNTATLGYMVYNPSTSARSGTARATILWLKVTA